MSGEIIANLGVGVALAGLILTSVRGLRQDMQAQIGGLAWRDRGAAWRDREAPRTHGASWRIAGRIARGHHRTDGGQLGEGLRKMSHHAMTREQALKALELHADASFQEIIESLIQARTRSRGWDFER